MSTRLQNANSMPSDGRSKQRLHSRTRLRASVTPSLLILALGTAVAIHGNRALKASPSPRPSVGKPPAGTYSLLYSFGSGADGCAPYAGLIRDSSGNLYGTTGYGGQYGNGTVFKVTSSGTETVLHSFGPPPDGSNPTYGSLTLDAAGNLYGTTYGGGLGYGTVFKVTATGRESILYTFCRQSGCADGLGPYGGMVRDTAGNFYGTTQNGGAYGAGAAFKLTPAHTETVLHSFGSSSTDGYDPTSNLTRDPSGHLYGTTYGGGPSGFGTVFGVSASGTESLLYRFKGAPADGANPEGGGLLLDSSGNLYGVATRGGAAGHGVVFKLTPQGTESVLFDFSSTGGTGGEFPIDGLARDKAGNLYGTTRYGGPGAGCSPYGCGVLFKLATTGSEIVLHDFTLDSSSDGASPYGGVSPDPSGNLYGTLSEGGAYGCGAVFKYTP